MTILEYVKTIMKSCSFLSLNDFSLATNYTEETSLIFSIEPEPSNPVIKKYMHGEELRRFTFSLACWKQAFEEADRVLNFETYEKLSDWFADLSLRREFEPMGDGLQAMKIRALGNAYMTQRSNDNDNELYLMQCEFEYLKKGAEI